MRKVKSPSRKPLWLSLKENHIINYKLVYLKIKSGDQHPLRLLRLGGAPERKKTACPERLFERRNCLAK